MNKKHLLLLALPFFYCIQSCNNQQKDNRDSKIDSTGLAFIKNADQASQVEIKAATIARSTSKNPRITSFAQTLLKDYNNSLQKLQNIKTKASVSGAYQISPEHKKMLDSISKLRAAEFDKAYMNIVALDNSGKIVIQFINATQDKSAAIDTFARRAIPMMQAHLDSVNKISAALK